MTPDQPNPETAPTRDVAAEISSQMAAFAAAARPKGRFSQNDEDTIILKWFRDHPPKFGKRLLDVGAWDGVEMSNSRALVEEGWNAVLVEAAAGPLTRLMKHSRSFKATRLVHGFVTGSATQQHTSRLTVLQHTEDAVSTADPAVFAAWRPVVKDYFPLVVPVVRVSDLLEMFPGPFDFVTIDTEGETFSIFCDLLDLADISCVCVEHSVAGISSLEQIRGLAFSKGYQEISLNGENVIFGKT